MAEPFLKVKGTDELICDQIKTYSYWNMPWGKVGRTPISGGFYPQNTQAGTLRMKVSLRFRAGHPTSPLDNYFRLFALERADATQVYRFRDLQGFTRDVQIGESPFGDDIASVIDLREVEAPLEDIINIDVMLVVPGYLPVEMGP